MVLHPGLRRLAVAVAFGPNSEDEFFIKKGGSRLYLDNGRFHVAAVCIAGEVSEGLGVAPAKTPLDSDSVGAPPCMFRLA